MTDLFVDDKSADFAAYIPGETAKYKSLEELAKGAYEKDRHIKTVEQENAELRASNLQLRNDNTEKATLEEYLDRITRASAAGSNPASSGTNPKPNDVQPLDPKQLEPMFKKTLMEYEAAKTKEQNTKVVVDALKERYGHNYVEVLNKQTEELGLSKEAVNYLAETAPKAFFKTLGLDQAPIKEPFMAPPKKSPFFAPTAEPKRSWSYYQDLKKNNPRLFGDAKIQQQMMNDYQKLGKDFEDGDFLSMGQDSAFM